MEQPQVRKYKMVLVGHEKVGKTSLQFKLTNQPLRQTYTNTVGIDFSSITVPDKQVRLQIWDTGGQERYHVLVPSYMRDSAMVCFVYSAGSLESFSRLNNLVQMMREECKHKQPICLLIANQIDLAGRQVSTETGEQFAFQNDMLYLEYSAFNDPRQVLLDKLLEALEKWELTA